MNKNLKIGSAVKATSVAALAAMALATTPAQAGVFGFVKSALKAEASKRIDHELDRRGINTSSEAASNQANGEAASGIWVAGGDVNGDGSDHTAAGSKLEQNGTTVASPGDVQAPGGKAQAALLLPAVQKVQAPQGVGEAPLLLPAVQKNRESARGQRAKLEQNGTTVASPGDVQAPGGKPQAALLLPAVQKVNSQAEPKRGKLKQNGTTVATAGEVAARARD